MKRPSEGNLRRGRSRTGPYQTPYEQFQSLLGGCRRVVGGWSRSWRFHGASSPSCRSSRASASWSSAGTRCVTFRPCWRIGFCFAKFCGPLPSTWRRSANAWPARFPLPPTHTRSPLHPCGAPCSVSGSRGSYRGGSQLRCWPL